MQPLIQEISETSCYWEGVLENTTPRLDAVTYTFSLSTCYRLLLETGHLSRYIFGLINRVILNFLLEKLGC